MNPVIIRPAEPSDFEQILNLVNDVVREMYGHLFPNGVTASTDPRSWKSSWVAVDGSIIAGVGLADGDCIDDLWLRPEYRGRKIGSELLSILESQIAKGGMCRQDCVSSRKTKLHEAFIVDMDGKN